MSAQTLATAHRTVKPGTRDQFSPANIRPGGFRYVGSFYVGDSDEIAAAYTISIGKLLRHWA